MDIRMSRDNSDTEGKLRCFNCNIYEHIEKSYQKLKKEKETRKYYKCNKVEHLVKDYKTGYKMKNKSI